MVRIPGYRSDSEEACRVEIRNPDPACNPYLAIAAVLSAGLKGIEEKLELCEPQEAHDFFNMDAKDIKQCGVDLLPQTLHEAVEIFAESDLMKEVLGAKTHDYLVQAKREDWRAYHRTVSEWELEHYLAVL